MDSRVAENKSPRPLRRSTRQSSSAVKVLSLEATPRGPLKRTRKGPKSKAAAVNGSREEESDSEDEESPSKKKRPETRGAEGDGGDENEMDVQEPVEDTEKNEDLEMDFKQDSSAVTHQLETCRGDVTLFPCVMLEERLRSTHAVNEDGDWIKSQRVTPPVKGPTKPASEVRPLANRHEAPTPKITSMAEYKKTMESKAKSAGLPTINHHVPSVHPASVKSFPTRQRVTNMKQKEITQHKKHGTKKTAVNKRSPGCSCGGVLWCLWRLALLVLLGSALLLACKIVPAVRQMAAGGAHPSGAANPEMFAGRFSRLVTRFTSQRLDLWKRSRMHLERHLSTDRPSEPVSLILTAGRRAERTLRCLARGLAASFSSALNASVLHIDGAGKARQDSDEVKLDIDGQLRAAFEGDKPVAVIHRIEELPPGSTLIFYRYCDHENAAYKRVFLLFTVLLPQDEVRAEQSLKEVEELVHDYVKERLVDASRQSGFNDMDIDKYGGLWSRISHLVLPVASEEEVEREGCVSTQEL